MLWAFFSLTRHALFGDLAVVDLLLQGVVTHQPVDVTGLPLPVAIHPTHCLGIVTRVPGGVEHHHSVGTDQVHPETASPERDSRNVHLHVSMVNMCACVFVCVCVCACLYK